MDIFQQRRHLNKIRSLQPHGANATQMVPSVDTGYDNTKILWPLPLVTANYYLRQLMGVDMNGFANSYDDSAQMQAFLGQLMSGDGLEAFPGFISTLSTDATNTFANVNRPYRFWMPFNGSETGNPSTDIGKLVYAKDNQSVTKDPTLTTYQNLVGRISSVATGTFPDTNPLGGNNAGAYCFIEPLFDVVNASGAGQRYRAKTNTTVTASTTLVGVNNLVAYGLAGRSYMFHAKLFTSNPAYGGIQVAIGGTATVTSLITEAKVYNTTTIQASAQATALATGFAGVTAASDSVEIWGQCVVNAAGTITIQFAQNASSPVNCVVKAGSYLEMYELPV